MSYLVKIYGLSHESFDSFDSLLVAEVNFPSFLAFTGSITISPRITVLYRGVNREIPRGEPDLI